MSNDKQDRVVPETGARRDSRTGKGRFDLISPIFKWRLALRMEGGLHYGERNWEKGMPLSWYLDSALRHLNEYELTGDPEHLDGAAFNIMGLVHTHWVLARGKYPDCLNDLPKYKEGFEIVDFAEGIDLSKWPLYESTVNTDEKETPNGRKQEEKSIQEWADTDPDQYWKCDEPECARTTHTSYIKCLHCGTPRPQPLEADRANLDCQTGPNG